MYHLNEDDILRCIRAVECYKDKTGSEYLWDIYDELQSKLNLYRDQNLEVESNEKH